MLLWSKQHWITYKYVKNTAGKKSLFEHMVSGQLADLYNFKIPFWIW